LPVGTGRTREPGDAEKARIQKARRDGLLERRRVFIRIAGKILRHLLPPCFFEHVADPLQCLSRKAVAHPEHPDPAQRFFPPFERVAHEFQRCSGFQSQSGTPRNFVGHRWPQLRGFDCGRLRSLQRFQHDRQARFPALPFAFPAIAFAAQNKVIFHFPVWAGIVNTLAPTFDEMQFAVFASLAMEPNIGVVSAIEIASLHVPACRVDFEFHDDRHATDPALPGLARSSLRRPCGQAEKCGQEE